MLLNVPLAKTPEREVDHKARSAADAVSFCVNTSKVSFESVVHWLLTSGWSDKFLPTDGLLTMVVMPSEERRVRSPMPECMRMEGVPTAPAERMTSFLAVTVVKAPDEHLNSTFWKTGLPWLVPHCSRRETCALIKTESFFRLLYCGARYEVRELLRVPLPIVNWVKPSSNNYNQNGNYHKRMRTYQFRYARQSCNQAWMETPLLVASFV